MKKWILLLVISLMITGCQPNDTNVNTSDDNQVDIVKIEDNNTPVKDTDETADSGPVIRDEKAVIEAFNALAIESVDPSALNSFLMDHISNLGIDSANYALVTYLDQVLEYAGKSDGDILSPSYQELARMTFGSNVDLEKLTEGIDVGFSDTVRMLYANGMYIEEIDSMYVSVVDFERILKNYGNEIGEDIKAYIELNQNIMKERIEISDLESMNRVAKLIVDHDKYLKIYPNSMVIDRVLNERNWLREVYFLEGINNDELLSSENIAAQSFNDVLQFYPGTELEKITTAFSNVMNQSSQFKTKVLSPYIHYYESAFKDNSYMLLELSTQEDLIYPVIKGTEKDVEIRNGIRNMLEGLYQRYNAENTGAWKIIQSYDIVYMDADKMSVILYVDLVHPKFPNLSIRDLVGHTFDLKTGMVLSLNEILPVSEESFTHLIADIQIFAGSSAFDMSGIGETWTGVYLTEEGIEIYKNGLHTENGVRTLSIPSEKITSWID